MVSQVSTNIWSQDNIDPLTVLTSVGLLITPTCPFCDLRGVTLFHTSSPDILSRYLLVKGVVDIVATYIHLAYAPVQPGQRLYF